MLYAYNSYYRHVTLRSDAHTGQVTGVLTQGKGDGKEWVTSYQVSYSMDAYVWHFVRDHYGNKKVSQLPYSILQLYILSLSFIPFCFATKYRRKLLMNNMKIYLLSCPSVSPDMFVAAASSQ